MQDKKLKNAHKRTAIEMSAEDSSVNNKLKNKLKKTNMVGNDEVNPTLEATSNGNQKTKKQKRKAEETITSNTEKSKKKKKKESKQCGENIEEDENSQETSNASNEKPIKKIDTSIFQYFTDLTQQDDGERLRAATQLIQQLHKTKEPEKRQKQLAYALKRLVRGCGAATNASRSGFFTGLVAFLKTFQNEELEVSNIFDTIQKELHVGATIANKEDADAVVGKILVCGAMLRAGRISLLNSEHLEKVTNILLQATRHRTYHASLGYAFLIEMLETALTQQQFEAAVWPLLLKELCKPWQKQTLQTVHCLIVVQRKFPTILNAKFLKAHFGGREIINNESFAHLYRIFWVHSDTHIITHPAFEAFGACLADSSCLVEFWTQTVDAGIKTTTKLLEFLTLKIATDVLVNLKPERTPLVVDLLSQNFMKMLIHGLKQIKLKKDETLKAFYDEYMEALVACCAKMPSTADDQKVAVIQRLILYPGSFDIEKFTSTRVVHQLINALGVSGIQQVFGIYKQIFCGTLPKQIDEDSNEEWQNFERLNAGYKLQHLLAHKALQHQSNASDWRTQQLQFLMICGLFHVQQTNVGENSFEPCKKEAACSFSKDYGEQCKNMFYASLQSKLSNLEQERQLLLHLVQFCNKRLQKQNFKNFLRIKMSDKNLELLHSAWQKVMAAMENKTTFTNNDETMKKSKKQKEKQKNLVEDKLQLVFHILLLNMGLQLFREVEMAAPAIDDLLKCMQRTQRKQTKKHSNGENSNEEAEPEWIEVVIDLFLHLLSQNAGAIRNSVNHLFPHLSSSLNVSAIHQILAVLDMKDGQNPLSRKGEDEETDDDDDEKEDNGDKVDDNDEESESGESSAEDDEEDDNDEDDDENVEEDDNDEDVTATDKLRNAISQALMANGAAVNASATDKNDDDDDMASIDLNEMTEEEGRRLDEALATAFKAMKKTPGNAQGTERKKSKSKRVETTALMHFRIRVLDLIEIYLQQPETDLLNHIEIMLTLYNMLQHCWSDELKPLQTKVEKVLQKLTTIKQAGAATRNETTRANDGSADYDLKPEDLVNYIRQIAEQKAPTLAFDLTNKIRNRCIVYLISSATKLPNGDAKVLDLCEQYQSEFLMSRNPTVNVTLLSEIYKLRWSGIWNLALSLVERGLQIETRAFRRIQVCEILAVLYKNNELQKHELSATQKSLKKIEKSLLVYVEALTVAWSQPQARQSHKEFQTLLDLLLHAQRAHARVQTTSGSLICSADFCEKVQELRRHIRLEATHMYHRYCGAFKLSVLRNTDVVLANSVDKLAATGTIEGDNDESEQLKSANGEPKVKTLKKNKNLQARKLKKQKKIERMLAVSKGINGGFGVQNSQTPDSDVSEAESN